MAKDMDTIVSLAKHRGFVFPGDDITVVYQTHGIMVL